MLNYTEKTSDKLNKKKLITIPLSLQSKVESASNEIHDEVRKLNQKFSHLEAVNSVIKQASSLLLKRMVDMERLCWSNAQYFGRECLKVVGIPDSVQNNKLEDKVLTIFKKTVSEVSPRDIEACNRLKKNKWQGNCQVLTTQGQWRDNVPKKDLKHLKIQEVGLPRNRLIFTNTSLCPNYHMLRSECRRLHDLGKISNFYISSGTIKVKISENRSSISITHTQDFVKYFPEVDLLPTS